MAKYGEKAHFILIYTIEAHPVGVISPYSDKEWTGRASTDKEGNPLGQPITYQARREMAVQAVSELAITLPVLVDEIDNPVWCTYGPAPNIGYLIGTDGVIVEKQPWYQPEQMEQAIIQYLGGAK